LEVLQGGLSRFFILKALDGGGHPDSKNACDGRCAWVIKFQRFGQSGPVELFLGLLLGVDVLHLVERGIFRDRAFPKYDFGLLLQSSSGHIIWDCVGLSGHVAVGYHLAGLGFTSFHVFERPVNGLPGWLLIHSGGESDDQLAVAKHADGESYVHPMMEAAQTLEGVSEGECFGFVVGPSRSIVPSYANYFLVTVVQNYEPTCSMAILGSSVELDMDVGSFHETGTGWEVNWLTQGSFSGLHIFQRVFQFLETVFHPQFFRGSPGVIDHELRLVAAKVNQKGVDLGVGLVGNLQQGA
jgi:hypothetical protein